MARGGQGLPRGPGTLSEYPCPIRGLRIGGAPLRHLRPPYVQRDPAFTSSSLRRHADQRARTSHLDTRLLSAGVPPAAYKTFQGGPGSSPTPKWATLWARGRTSGLGLSRHVHRPTQNLRDSRNRALACISGTIRAVAQSSLNYVQQLIRGKEYHAGALWSLSAYGLKPQPVLRIFLYGPEHTVFLSLRSDFLCASKLRTRFFSSARRGNLLVFGRVRSCYAPRSTFVPF